MSTFGDILEDPEPNDAVYDSNCSESDQVMFLPIVIICSIILIFSYIFLFTLAFIVYVQAKRGLQEIMAAGPMQRNYRLASDISNLTSHQMTINKEEISGLYAEFPEEYLEQQVSGPIADRHQSTAFKAFEEDEDLDYSKEAEELLKVLANPENFNSSQDKKEPRVDTLMYNMLRITGGIATRKVQKNEEMPKRAMSEPNTASIIHFNSGRAPKRVTRGVNSVFDLPPESSKDHVEDQRLNESSDQEYYPSRHRCSVSVTGEKPARDKRKALLLSKNSLRPNPTHSSNSWSEFTEVPVGDVILEDEEES